MTAALPPANAWRGRFAFLLSLALLATMATVALRVGSPRLDAFRIELGASDDAFLRGNQSAWGRAYRDSGPFRLRRGQRYMTYFAARMAFPGAALRIPASIESGDGEIRMRVHRYGQPGVIRVFGNGILLGRIEFRPDSYPWDVVRFDVPSSHFRPGELLLEFRGESLGGRDALPPHALLSFDWVELARKPPGSISLARHIEMLVLLLAVGLALALTWAGVGRVPAWLSSGVVTLGVLYVLASAPAPTVAALEHLPILLPFVGGVHLLLRVVFSCGRQRARALSTAFGCVLLAHSTIIFFPDHQPPDLGPHLGQVGRLSDSRFGWGHFWDFSTAHGTDGRGKPHFGADYAAPYPPWTYFLVHLLRHSVDHPRFWIEFVGMLSGAVLALLAYALANRLAGDRRAPWFAFALLSLEISIWHHASRAHTPGLVGQVLFVAAVACLVYRYESLQRRSSMALFALAAFAATMAYPAILFHLAFFMIFFTALELLERRRLWPSASTGRAIAASMLGTLGSFAAFYHRFVPPALASKSAILAEEGYRAPATFLFLRNMVRDAKRILVFGYPVFVLLALPAYVHLRAWTPGPFARRIVLAWTAAYVALLVLKDPVFFPQLLLHAKEDLLFAPLLCVLGAMTLAALSRRGRAGRGAVLGLLALLFVLQARDYLYNADTIAVWAESQR